MTDASMAEAHALPTDEVQRTLQSAITEVVDAGTSDSAAGSGNSTTAGGNLGVAEGDAQVTNSQSGTSTGTAGASGTTDADGRVLWSAAPEIDGLRFISSEKNDVAEYFRLSIYEDASGATYQLLETAGGLRRYLIVPAESEDSSKADSGKNSSGKKAAKSSVPAGNKENASATKSGSKQGVDRKSAHFTARAFRGWHRRSVPRQWHGSASPIGNSEARGGMMPKCVLPRRFPRHPAAWPRQ